MSLVETEKPVRLAVVAVLVIGAIAFLTQQHPPRIGGSGEPLLLENMTELSAERQGRIQRKAMRFDRARALEQPAGFINADNVSLRALVGDKVVLLDMWTYSCINCQRTLPYLQAWWERYRDDGLVIIGNHAPEFAFERKLPNVQDAVRRFNVTYPVVLDNHYGTWSAYNNRYWPQKYLIGVDGFIRYEHIGEGSYRETEDRIKELLRERARTRGEAIDLPRGYVQPHAEQVDHGRIGSPEVYFGAARNDHLANGDPGVTGTQAMDVPDDPRRNELYLDGRWRIDEESATATGAETGIVFRYHAKSVNMVLSANRSLDATVFLDGERIDAASAGRDVRDGVVTVREERLYSLVADDDYGTHTLRVTTDAPGLTAYTFTFG